MNGFIPSRDMCDPGVIVGGARVRQGKRPTGTPLRWPSSATRRLLFTSFESCDLKPPERLRLHIPRIRLRNGVRTCDIEPSSYLQELNLGPKQISAQPINATRQLRYLSKFKGRCQFDPEMAYHCQLKAEMARKCHFIAEMASPSYHFGVELAFATRFTKAM